MNEIKLAFEQEVAQLIIDVLKLEDVTQSDIDPQAPLFGDGLGLDSIDALELSLGIARRYGVKISAESANVEELFGSLRKLAAHIDAHRTAN